MEIKNCAAIVTGGASGMGAATAKLLSSLGAKVALLDLNKDAAEKIAADIQGLAVPCDVTSADSVEAAMKELGENDYTEEEIRVMRIKFLSDFGN